MLQVVKKHLGPIGVISPVAAAASVVVVVAVRKHLAP